MYPLIFLFFLSNIFLIKTSAYIFISYILYKIWLFKFGYDLWNMPSDVYCICMALIRGLNLKFVCKIYLPNNFITVNDFCLRDCKWTFTFTVYIYIYGSIVAWDVPQSIILIDLHNDIFITCSYIKNGTCWW